MEPPVKSFLQFGWVRDNYFNYSGTYSSDSDVMCPYDGGRDFYDEKVDWNVDVSCCSSNFWKKLLFQKIF